MLPGFRFLFAAIVLSLSVLVFGLGAAALLRAAHEEFASMPSRRAPAEPVFAQQAETSTPTLALLRVEPSVAEKAPDTVAAAVVPEAAAPSEQAGDATPAAPEKSAAGKPDESAPAEAVKPEIPAVETTQAAPATPTEVEAPASVDETRLATVAAAPQVNEAAPTQATTEAPSPEAPALEANAAAMKIATLGGPAVTIEQPASLKKAEAKPDRSTARKRTKEQRRIARRARLGRQAASQQSTDPFGQPTIVRPR